MNNPWRIRQQVNKLESDAETLAAIKLIRARGRASQSMLALCDMLEHRLKEEDGRAPKFDRSAYQRQYMRDRRAAAKLGITTQEYRNRNDDERCDYGISRPPDGAAI